MKNSTESPPSCSLTASPERTTEKKLVNITTARDKTKMAASRQSRPVSLNFACSECKAMHKNSFITYQSDSDLGNCELCGTFYNLKAVRLAGKRVSGISHAIRETDQKYRAEIPMDIILSKLIEDGNHLNPKYRPDSFYLANREMFVEWIHDLSEKLRV